MILIKRLLVSSFIHVSYLLNRAIIIGEATEAAANVDESLDDDVAPDGSACFDAAASSR